MIQISIFIGMAAYLLFGGLNVASASMPTCFQYNKGKNPDNVCIVTKVEGHNICMEEYHIPSKTKGPGGCFFIRDTAGVSSGDHIIIDADEWKGYSEKCYKSPGCGKAVVVGQGTSGKERSPSTTLPQGTQKKSGLSPVSKKGTQQVTYTTVDAICADGAQASGKIAEIAELTVHEAFPDVIKLRRGNRICNRLYYVSLNPSDALAKQLEPYGPDNNIHTIPKLTVKFKVIKIDNMAIWGEFIDFFVQTPPKESASLPPPGGEKKEVEEAISLPPPSKASGQEEVNSLPPPVAPVQAQKPAEQVTSQPQQSSEQRETQDGVTTEVGKAAKDGVIEGVKEGIGRTLRGLFR